MTKIFEKYKFASCQWVIQDDVHYYIYQWCSLTEGNIHTINVCNNDGHLRSRVEYGAVIMDNWEVQLNKKPGISVGGEFSASEVHMCEGLCFYIF